MMRGRVRWNYGNENSDIPREEKKTLLRRTVPEKFWSGFLL